jgi:positive regulator of sigma E activity
MKSLAILLVIIEFVYLFTLKLASFMISLLAIVFAALFIQNMVRNSAAQTQPLKHGARP